MSILDLTMSCEAVSYTHLDVYKRQKYDGFVITAIRRIVHSFFSENISPTLTAVLAKINEDPTLPDLERSTLWKILTENGFCFEKRKKSPSFGKKRHYFVVAFIPKENEKV